MKIKKQMGFLMVVIFLAIVGLITAFFIWQNGNSQLDSDCIENVQIDTFIFTDAGCSEIDENQICQNEGYDNAGSCKSLLNGDSEYTCIKEECD